MNISENRFFELLHISLSMYVPILKFCIGIAIIAVEGTVSQIFYIGLGPRSSFIK